jgi:ElaB/YqjD/DUF883 family membrane-anchored ribosome-binding protein
MAVTRQGTITSHADEEHSTSENVQISPEEHGGDRLAQLEARLEARLVEAQTRLEERQARMEEQIQRMSSKADESIARLAEQQARATTDVNKEIEKLVRIVGLMAEQHTRAATPTPQPTPLAAAEQTPMEEQGEPSRVQDVEVPRRPGKEILREEPVDPLAENVQGRPRAMAPLKVDAKLELPVYNGEIDGEKLDGWIDQMESYFSLYGYEDAQCLAFARLKLASHALVWWNAHLRSRGSAGLTWEAFKVLLKEQFYPVGYDEDRWRRWQYIRQRDDQNVQDYTTEFRRLALVLGVPLENRETLRMYLGGLRDELREEVDLIPLQDIGEACKRATVFERLNRTRTRGAAKATPKASLNVAKEEATQEGAHEKTKSKYCKHCKFKGHTTAECWKLHPELAPKKKKDDGAGGQGRAALVTTVNEEVTDIGHVREPDPFLSLMVRVKEASSKHKPAEKAQGGRPGKLSGTIKEMSRKAPSHPNH